MTEQNVAKGPEVRSTVADQRLFTEEIRGTQKNYSSEIHDVFQMEMDLHRQVHRVLVIGRSRRRRKQPARTPAANNAYSVEPRSHEGGGADLP